MDETIFEERLSKIVEHCRTLNNEVSYIDLAMALNMAPEIVKSTISIYVARKQKELEKNPLIAMSGPDEKLEILIYKIKELARARFYIEGQKQFLKVAQGAANIKGRITGLFKRGGK